MCKHFHVPVSFGYQYFHKRSTFVRWIWPLQGAATLVCSLPMKSRKRLAHNVFDAFATQASLVHDITDKDCWAQNSSICGHVFATFKHKFFTQKEEDFCPPPPSPPTAACLFYFSFLGVGPLMRLCFSSPLRESRWSWWYCLAASCHALYNNILCGEYWQTLTLLLVCNWCSLCLASGEG